MGETVDTRRLSDTGHPLRLRKKEGGEVSSSVEGVGSRAHHSLPPCLAPFQSSVERTEMMMCGMFPSSAMILSLSIVSLLPTTSSRYFGRYFSTLHRSGPSRQLATDPSAAPGFQPPHDPLARLTMVVRTTLPALPSFQTQSSACRPQRKRRLPSLVGSIDEVWRERAHANQS